MLIKKYPASEFIRNAMEIKGLSPYQLSKYTTIPNKTLSLLLNNKTHLTIKMDYKIAKILGFDVGILSAIEAKYLEYCDQLKKSKKGEKSNLSTIVNIVIENHNRFLCDMWNFRKHQVNEEKLFIFLDKCENRISKIKSKGFDKLLFKNFVFTSLYKSILELNYSNVDKLNEIIKLLSDYGVIVLLSDDSINIRGLSREYNETYFIIINKNLNKSTDKFIFTLMHEIFHLYINDYFSINTDRKNNESLESSVDELAINFLLNNNYDILKNISLKKPNVITTTAEKLNINRICLQGFADYMNKDFAKRRKEAINFELFKTLD